MYICMCVNRYTYVIYMYEHMDVQLNHFALPLKLGKLSLRQGNLFPFTFAQCTLCPHLYLFYFLLLYFIMQLQERAWESDGPKL